MDVETIKAIGEAWLALFVVCFTILAIIFRKPLITVLQRFFEVRVKKGETELLYRQLPEAAEAKPDIRPEEKAAPERLIEEAADKTSKLEARTPGEWESEMFHAFWSGNIEEGETAFTRVQEAETDSVKRKKNEVLAARGQSFTFDTLCKPSPIDPTLSTQSGVEALLLAMMELPVESSRQIRVQSQAPKVRHSQHTDYLPPE